MSYFNLFLFLLIMANKSFAVSFDCNNATTKTEKAVCNNSDLSNLDDELAKIYKQILAKDISIRNSQRGWIKLRDLCESDSCLINSYKDRIYVLNLILKDKDDEVYKLEINNQEINNQEISNQEISNQEIMIAEDNNIIIPEREIVKESPSVNKNNVSIPAPEVDNVEILSNLLEKFFNFVGVLLVIGAVVVYFGISLKCPRCGKWFSAREIRRDLIGKSNGRKTVTREDRHKNAQGLDEKTVQRQEQVDTIIEKYEIFHRCSACNHTWETMVSKETVP